MCEAASIAKRHGTFKRTKAGLLLDVARDDVIESVRRARQRTWLTSPFLSASIAELIADAATFSGASDLRLITALGDDAVRRGVLSVKGLEVLHAAGFELRSVPNLHAKAAVVDEDWGLAGSGNLTVSGLGAQANGNVELGVVLDRKQVSSAARHFKNWWKSATPIRGKDLARYRRWEPRQATKGQSGRNHGSVHGSPIPLPPGRELERFEAENYPRRSDRGYWLKMLYYDERDLDRWWEEMTWVSDVHRRRKSDDEPLLCPSYQAGDLLVLYLVGQGCPAIAEVKTEPKFDPDRVQRQANRSDARRWGWLTEVRIVHRHKTGLDDAPTLQDLGISPGSVRQHGHIRISAEAYARALRRMKPHTDRRSRPKL